MAPESYHAFFSGCVSVAGALIGLLFVAISIRPHKLAGDEASLAFRVSAGTAFSLLTNALVIPLVALLPDTNIDLAAFILSGTGLSSMGGLAAILLRDPAFDGRRSRGAVRVLVPSAIFVGQLANAFWLGHSPHQTGPIGLEALLIIFCFLGAIDRAWELLGGTESGLIHLFVRRRSQRSTADPGGSPGA